MKILKCAAIKAPQKFLHALVTRRANNGRENQEHFENTLWPGVLQRRPDLFEQLQKRSGLNVRWKRPEVRGAIETTRNRPSACVTNMLETKRK